MRRLTILIGILAGLFLFCGCGGDDPAAPAPVENSPGGSESPVDQTAPQVTEHLPEAGAGEVAPETVIRIVFSEALDPATVTGTNILLEGAGGAIAGDLAVDGEVVLFTPAEALSAGSLYTVSLGTGITDRAGNALGAPYLWSFTTRTTEFAAEPGWGTPLRLSAEGAQTRSFDRFSSDWAQVRMDDAGDGLAVWQQRGESVDELWASRYSATEAAWSAPFRLSEAGVEAGYPTLAVNRAGEAVIVWQSYYPGEDLTILDSRFYRPEAGWGEILEVNANAYSPRVVLDEAGVATVTWQRSKPLPSNPASGRSKTVGANRFVPGQGWSVESILEDLDFTDYSSSVASPVPAIDPQGRVHTLWRKAYGGSYFLRHAVYGAQGWEDAIDAHVAGEYIAAFVPLASDGAGTLHAAWLENTATAERKLQTMRFDPLEGWTSPVLIAETTELPERPGLAVNEEGSAIIVWRETGELNREAILARRYVPVQGWSPPEAVENFERFAAEYGSVDYNAEPAATPLGGGDFLVAWQQAGEVSGSILGVNRYVAGEGWQAPETFGDGSASLWSAWPVLTSTVSGKALMVWGQSDGGTWGMSYGTGVAATQDAAPVADAGTDQMVAPNGTIVLDGSRSVTVQEASYLQWSFLSVPMGSQASLTDPEAQHPVFAADEEGTYLLLLEVGDGSLTFATDSVEIRAISPEAPLPDTGQETCRDLSGRSISCEGTGQDGDYAIRPMELYDNGNGTVTDAVTGLYWQKAENVAAYSAIVAASVCDTLTLAGYGDWRLPSALELMTLVNYERLSPAIDPVLFPSASSSMYWSASTDAVSTNFLWGVDFYTGQLAIAGTANEYPVRCVRNGAAGSPTLTDNGNGTVFDRSSGLMWQQAEGGEGNWDEALTFCEDLDLAHYTDWRLPTVKELRSLIDEGRSQPALDTGYFPEAAAAAYWSSTNYIPNAFSVWKVDFRDGIVNSDLRSSLQRIRCVR